MIEGRMNFQKALDFCWEHGAKVNFIKVYGKRRVEMRVARHLIVERDTLEEAAQAMKERIDVWLKSGRTGLKFTDTEQLRK